MTHQIITRELAEKWRDEALARVADYQACAKREQARAHDYREAGQLDLARTSDDNARLWAKLAAGAEREAPAMCRASHPGDFADNGKGDPKPWPTRSA